MQSQETYDQTSRRPNGDIPIAIGIVIYGIAVMALVWLNPQSRIHPVQAVLSLSRGLEGQWRFPWQHFHALGIFAITILAAEALGKLAAVRDWAIRILAGYGMMGLIVFILGVLGLYVELMFWGFVVLILAIRWAVQFASSNRFKVQRSQPGIDDTGGVRTTLWEWGLIAILLLPLIGYTLTPPIQSDGIRYHLAALQEYLKAGGITYLPFNAFSNLPFLVEMIFLVPMGLGSDVATQLVHLSFLLISAELVWRILDEHVEGFRFYVARPLTRFFVIYLFLSLPVVVIVSTWPFIDAALLAFFLAMLLTLFRWLQNPKATHHLLWCGFFAGCCVASKYTMVVFAGTIMMIVVLFFLDVLRKYEFKLSLKPILLFGAIIVVVGSPWYIKNLIYTGNPVYPMANGLFKGGEWDEASAQLFASKAGAKGMKTPLGFVAGPVLATVSWTPLPETSGWMARLNYEDQFPGPIFLVMLPLCVSAAIMLLFRQRSRFRPMWFYPPYLIIIISIMFYVFWFFTYQSNRFMLPLYALAIFGVVFAIDFISPRRFVNAIIVVLIITGIYGYAWSLEWMYARTRVAPLPYLLGFQSRNDYIAAALPHTQGFKVLEGLAGPGERTLFVGEYRGYYCKTPYVSNDFFDQPVILEYLRRAELNIGQLRQELLEDDIHFIYLNWAELQLYMIDFRQFFSPKEWQAFEQFLNAAWLKKIDWESPPGYIIYRIHVE